MTASLTASPLDAENWPALEDLFGKGGASNGCWCMYWRIGPRYHERPRAENREDRKRLAASEQRSGLLAFDGQQPVGWCELAPRADLGWLAHSKFLDPIDELPVWSVPCFYVRRSHRRQGVSSHLIEAAARHASAAGAPRWRRTPSTPPSQATPATSSPAQPPRSPPTASKPSPDAAQTAPSCARPSRTRRSRGNVRVVADFGSEQVVLSRVTARDLTDQSAEASE